MKQLSEMNLEFFGSFPLADSLCHKRNIYPSFQRDLQGPPKDIWVLLGPILFPNPTPNPESPKDMGRVPSRELTYPPEMAF